MKYFFSLTFTIFCIVVSASAQGWYVDTLRLKSAYADLVLHQQNYKAQKNFFESFPENWQQFISTYRYMGKEEGAESLYACYASHLAAFTNNLNLMDDYLYCSKVVELAIGAQLDADAPNMLQELEHQMMKDKTSLMMRIICQELTPADQMLYWQFYWSSVVFFKDYESESMELANTFSALYPEEVETMTIAHRYFNGHACFADEVKNRVGLKATDGKCY